MKKPNRLVSSFSSRTQTAATWISDASLKTPRTYEATSHTPEGATWKGNTGGLPWSSSSAAAAAAKSFQSCLTLCDPIDSSPPGSSVPGILQARTLEWGAIFFSNAWKWKVKVKSLSCPTLSGPMDCSLPGSSVHGIFQARVLEWGAIAFSEKCIMLVQNQNMDSAPSIILQGSRQLSSNRDGYLEVRKGSHNVLLDEN